MNAYIEALLLQEPERQQYPHCDWRVLHSPQANCEYCNHHPDWQQARVEFKMLFTDDPRNAQLIEHYFETGQFKEGERPCPAMLARGDKCQVWSGNVAMTPEMKAAREEYWRAWRKSFGIEGDQ